MWRSSVWMVLLPHRLRSPAMFPPSMLLCRCQILTYTEAVKTVDHDKAVGKPNSLWIAFAKFYEKHGDIDNARVIFNKAVQVGMTVR